MMPRILNLVSEVTVIAEKGKDFPVKFTLTGTFKFISVLIK